MSASRMLRVLGAVTMAMFFISAFTPFSNALNGWTRMQSDLRLGDAIVVLGSGLHPPGLLSHRSTAHTLHGIELWRRGLAPFLLFSGPASSGGGPSEASVRRGLARQLGVPSDHILVDSGGLTTRSEAQSIRRLPQFRNARRVLLVADARRLRRARDAFLRVGFEVIPAPPPDVLAAATSPQGRLVLSRQILEEMLARVYYRVTGMG